MNKKEMKITREDWKEYKSNASKILSDNGQYATKKAIEIAINKEIAMKPVEITDSRGFVHECCPNCGRESIYIVSCGTETIPLLWCYNCGQHIDRRDFYGNYDV